MNGCTVIARVPTVLATAISIFAPISAAQRTKESTYTVGSKAIISVTNNYGPITVKSSGNRQVVVKATSPSDAVSFEHEQHGNRIELRSRSLTPGTGFAAYTVLVPKDSWVMLRSLDGALRAEGLNGDVVLESAAASVEVRDISDAHLHVKTLNGPITLTAIRNCHLDVRSVSGSVNLHDVTGSSAEVNSGGGRITYEGDPDPAGEYALTSHSGDIDVSIPADAFVEIKSRSIKGEFDQGPNSGGASAMGQRRLLLRPGISSVSRFVLRSLRGNIRLKRP
jgi:DUF4097 and DUF4098 domain-containing protein YvlB